jgi:hypothetical protein
MLLGNQCLKLTIRVEEVCRVVPRAVVPVAGLAVRAEAALDTRAVERVDLLLLPCVEAEVKVLRRRLAVGDVQVGEAGLVVTLGYKVTRGT